MTVCVQCLYTESWNEIARLVIPNIEGYCKKHNYLWNIQTTPEPYDGFEKLRHIKEIFENDEADVILSLDCDVLITNYNKKIEDFLNYPQWFLISEDVNGLNAGVFIIKKSHWTNGFLNYCLDQKGKEKMYCEQNAFEKYMQKFPTLTKEMIRILPQSDFNSYRYDLYDLHKDITEEERGMWKEGKSFILHLPGLGMFTRIETLKSTKVTE